MLTNLHQVDENGIYLHSQEYSSKPFRAVAADLPTIDAGELAQWSTALNPVTDEAWGDVGTGTWAVLADNRTTPLYLTADGSRYTIDQEVSGESFNGVGPVPVWLTTTAKPGQFYNWTSDAWVLDIAAQLADAQATQVAAIYTGYAAAVTKSVSYETAAAVTQTYQADTNSQTILLQAVTGYNAAGQTPAGFYWVAQDNTQVPFTLADLKGLYAVMLTQGWTAFQHLQTQKVAIRNAGTMAAVQAVVW